MNSILAAQRFLFRLTILTAIVSTLVIIPQSASAQDDAGASPAQADVPPPPSPRPPQPATAAIESAEEVESADPGYEVLLQGPVHEAFAAPIDIDLSDSARLYSQAPPDSIDEQPPEDKPPDDGSVWIPGYWSWSDDANKYVWVSGFYRRAPPGRVWVEGYWSRNDSGYRWTSGYWARAQASDEGERLLPVPPESIDNGPSSPPPGEDFFWLPGQWNYVDDDYQWRSGYWTQCYEDWIWHPDCYVDTPQGCVFVDGYWDRLPPQRGQLFAPVDFYSPVYLQPSYVYRPCYPLADPASILLHLFVRRGFRNFFWGDFYGPRYASLGFRPWYDFGFGLGPVAPWIRYYDWRYRRRGIDFVGSMRRYDSLYRGNPSLRPPKSFKVNHHVGLTGKATRSVAGVTGGQARTFDAYVRGKVGGQAVKRVSTTSAGFGKPSAGQPAAIRGIGSSTARRSGATSSRSGLGRGSRGSIRSGALASGAPRFGPPASGALGSGAKTPRSFGVPGSSGSRLPSNPQGRSSLPAMSSAARTSGLRALDSRSSLSRSSGSRGLSPPGNAGSERGPSFRSGPSVQASPSLGRGRSIGRSSSFGGGPSFGRGSSSAMRGQGSFKSPGRSGSGGGSLKSSGRGKIGGGSRGKGRGK
jgi:hypothetical protein